MPPSPTQTIVTSTINLLTISVEALVTASVLVELLGDPLNATRLDTIREEVNDVLQAFKDLPPFPPATS